MKTNKTNPKAKQGPRRRSQRDTFVPWEPDEGDFQGSAEGERRRLVETFRDMGIEAS